MNKIDKQKNLKQVITKTKFILALRIRTWEPNDSDWKQYNDANIHLLASGGSRNNEWSYYQENAGQPNQQFLYHNKN